MCHMIESLDVMSGVGRMIAETAITPTVIPVWHVGKPFIHSIIINNLTLSAKYYMNLLHKCIYIV